MKRLIVGCFLLCISSAHASKNIPEVEEIPPEKMAKTFTATVTAHGVDERYFGDGLTSVTIINGFSSQPECMEAAHSIARAVIEAAKFMETEKYKIGPTFSCRSETSYRD